MLQTVGGCSADDEVMVEIEGGPLTASVFVSPSNNICKNDTVYLQVIANGGNTGFYQYTWKDHLGNLLSSDSLLVHRPDSDITYFAEVFDGSVIITDSASVTVHPRPEVDIAPEEYDLLPDRTIIVCIYDSVFLDAGNEGYNYLWSNGSSNHEIIAYTTGIGIDYQQHIVSVSNPETSCSTMDTLNIIFTFGACTGISSMDNFDVSIWPNPVKDLLYIDYLSGTYPIIMSVFDVMGTELMKHEIKKQSKTENKLQIHFADWADGIYFLIFTANFKSRTFKIVKL